MFKERTLPFDYGLDNFVPGHLYSSMSGGGSEAAAELNKWDKLEVMMEIRELGKRNANVVLPDKVSSMLGFEQFESTTLKRPSFNSCHHMKTGGVCYPYTGAYKNGKGSVYYEFFFRASTTWVCPPIPILTRHFPVDVSTAQRTAYGVMQPRFEGNISMMNFLIELKDFKSLARFLTNKPVKKLSNMFRRLIKKPKFDITKPLAEAHLANEFALKPLISDIVSISNQIGALVTDVQREFADAGRERNTMHYSEVFPISESSVINAYYQGKYPYWMVGVNEQFTFNASMEYDYQYSMRDSISAFTKYWGLATNAEVIWNAIPGSFLIDYVLKVGDALAINSRDKNVLLNVSQYCESFLSERSSGKHFRAPYMYSPLIGCGRKPKYPAPAGNYLITGDMSSLYTRNVTSPNTGPVMPRLAVPSTKQGWNVLALARCFF